MLEKHHPIKDVAALKARFGAMFAGPTIGLQFCKGWFPILVGLCFQIERVLGEQCGCFRWVQIKEKFGVMRLHFHFGGAPALRDALHELTAQARRESARRCMVCGDAGRLSDQSAWMVTVCQVHQPEQVRQRGGRSLRELMAVPEGGEGVK